MILIALIVFIIGFFSGLIASSKLIARQAIRCLSLEELYQFRNLVRKLKTKVIIRRKK